MPTRHNIMPGDKVLIEYLGNKPIPVVWYSCDLNDDSRHMLIVQAKAQCTGYCSYRLYINDTMVYPRKRDKASYPGQTVCIEVVGVSADTVQEKFSCTERQKAEILVARYSWAMRTAVNAEYIQILNGKIAELTDKYGGDILVTR